MKIELEVPEYGAQVFIIDVKRSRKRCKTCGSLESKSRYVVKKATAFGYVAYSERKKGTDEVQLIVRVLGNRGTQRAKLTDVFSNREDAIVEMKLRNASTKGDI